RNPTTVVLTGASRILLIGVGGSVFQHHTGRPAQWSRFMQRMIDPVLGAALLEDPTEAVNDLDETLWQALLDGEYLLQSNNPEILVELRDRIFFDNQGYHLIPDDRACQHLIFACTGSIVSGLIAPTILSLLYSGFQRRLEVILTEAAQRFVTR